MKIKHKLTNTDHGQPGSATGLPSPSAAMPIPADVPSRIRSAVLAAYAAAPDDWDRAAASMLASIRGDSAVCSALLRRACYYEVRMIASEKRGEYGKRPEPGQDKALLGLRTIAKESLMNFPLIGGKLLGDATRSEILRSAAFYRDQARANVGRALFLEKVAGELKDDETVVRKAIKERGLALIHEQAKKEAA